MTQQQWLDKLTFLDGLNLEAIYPMTDHPDGTYAELPENVRLVYEDDEASSMVFVYVLDGSEKIYVGYYGYDYRGNVGGFYATFCQPS